MRNFLLVVFFLIAQVAISQNEFVFNENGLAPEQTTTQVNGLSKTKLCEQSMVWVHDNYKNAQIVIGYGEFVFTDIKGNFIKANKSYYSVKYSVKISFEKGQFTLKPLEVYTKLNSKYDMGWQPFDLKDGSSFFKRKKPIKSTKDYVKKIPALFNELNANLLRLLK